jgi:dipeptidyl aminopeptidase/acylaminoacyl peptidase
MTRIPIGEKYERSGWPSLQRPDLQPPTGWSLELWTASSHVYHHSLSPDGRQVAFFWAQDDRADLYCLDVEGGWPQRLTFNRPPKPYFWDEVPQWSPDGEWIAYTQDDHVFVLPAAGGVPHKITTYAASASAPAWLPDSQRLVVSLIAEERPCLGLVDRQGRSLRRLTSAAGDDSDPRPNPQGKKLVYVHAPDDDLRRLDLFLLDLESGRSDRLVGAAGQKNWNPRWSPDGSWIAFLSQGSGFNEIWLVHPDGAGLHRLADIGCDAGWLAWSPDGGQIACTLNRQGAFELALLEAADGRVTILAGGPGVYSRPQWSPGGDFLSLEYESPLHPPEIYRFEHPSGARTALTRAAPPALARLDHVLPESLSYASLDGLEIHALLYRPRQPNGAAIVRPHGGPSDQYGYAWDAEAQYLCAKGYAVLAPNYHGSTGYGAAFEHTNYGQWGQGDVQDCLLAADFLQAQAGIAAGRIAILGGSYGGYLAVSCLAGDPQQRYACGVARYGDADLASSWALCDRSTRRYTEMQIGTPAAQPVAYREGSPIFKVENIRKPLLILHGLEDTVVPPQASEELVEALRRAGKTFEYKTYAGEGHGFLRQAALVDACTRIQRFLDWYLMPRMKQPIQEMPS